MPGYLFSAGRLPEKKEDRARYHNDSGPGPAIYLQPETMGEFYQEYIVRVDGE